LKKFKIFSLIVSVTLVASLISGCSTAKKTIPQASLSDKSPITITFYNADGNAKSSTFTDPIAKEITKETGVTLKIDYPVAGNTQRVPLMIASGQYPDIIYAKGDTPKLVEAGALLELDKMITTSPNISSVYGKYLSRLKYSLDDPKTYTLGAYGVDSALWNPGGILAIQHAVLKDQGYPQIKTMKDYEDSIAAYMKKYPTINGQKTIGLSLLADDWKWLISVGNSASSALGSPDNGEWAIDSNTNVATYKFMQPDMKEYYRVLNDMNAKGLLDPESFTQKTDAYLAKLSTGRVLAIADASWDYGTAVTTLVKAGTPERTWATLPIVLDSSKYKNASMTNQGYGGSTGIGITTSCKNPKRVMAFLDWMASDKAQILNNWGIEGVDYTIENGKRTVTAAEQTMKNTDPDYSVKTGVGLYSYPFPQRGDGVKDPSGQNYTTANTETITKNYNSAEKETLTAYKVDMWKDLYPPTSAFKEPEYGAAWLTNIPADSQLNISLTKADAESQKSIPKAILASPANFDKVWDDYQASLKKIGMEKANADFTKLLKDKVKLWGK